MGVTPEEDRHLKQCQHDWVDTYSGSGLSRRTPDVQIVVFFCKKCLEIRKKHIDVSDQLLNPDITELYE